VYKRQVLRIDIEKRCAISSSGEEFDYNKLLIATGASPTMPDIQGISSERVFGLRTLDDAKGILKFCSQSKNAVVLGGGFVALKAAYAMRKAGIMVTCIVSSKRLLSQMLDEKSAEMVAQVLIANGINIEFGVDVAGISNPENSSVAGVRLTDGREIPAGVIVVGKGVKPNTDFLNDSGIAICRGITVDGYMQTSEEDIFAAGDVAQTYDIAAGSYKINAVWPNAMDQGKVAGLNMAGVPTEYEGSIGMNSIEFFNLSIMAAGISNTVDNADFETTSSTSSKGIYKRLVIKDDILVGYIIAGPRGCTAKAGILTQLIKERLPLGRGRRELESGTIRNRHLW
jgi:NAD(P)H-nitrite reductase large subunit